jgi:hypothetical protein
MAAPSFETFMRALTAQDVLTPAEKAQERGSAMQTARDANWLAGRRAKIAFYHASAAATRHLVARMTGSAPAEKLAAYLDELHQTGELVARMDQWAAIDKPTKAQRDFFRKAIKDFRLSDGCPQALQLWLLHHSEWTSKLVDG